MSADRPPVFNPDLDPGDTTAGSALESEDQRDGAPRMRPLRPARAASPGPRSAHGVVASAAPFPAGVRLSRAFEDDEELRKVWALVAFDRHSRESFSSLFLRIPILLVVAILLLVDIFLYILVRQAVVVYERAYVWAGRAGRLRGRLREAKSYGEWKRAALALDKHLGNSKWKRRGAVEGVGEFDADLIERTVARLRRYRLLHTKHADEHSARRLTETLLQTCCKPNAGGVENAMLYSHAYWGTKALVEEYVREVVLSLQHVAETHTIPLQAKRAFFKDAAREYGRSALCLSGGAGFGYYHLGVLKALLDVDMDEAFSDNTLPPPAADDSHHDDATSDGDTYHAGNAQRSPLTFPSGASPGPAGAAPAVSLIPSVVTGTSAGSLIAAMLCTRTDAELRREVLTADLWRLLTACEDDLMTRARRLWKEGTTFDTEAWIEKTRAVTYGDITFLEAYRKTGRILNISVIPEEPNAPPKVLNYVTAPNVVVWSAVIASSAVPLILKPVELVQKDPDGALRPFRGSGRRWRDGSLRVDIPEGTLHRLFNVNFTVVSQVNPHVALWFYNRRGAPGRPTAHRRGMGWRGGFFLSTMEQWLKLDIIKYLQLVRDMALLPRVMGHDPSFVFLQNFEGSVTIVPKVTFEDYTHILTDPDERRLRHYMAGGERQAWPKLHLIANRLGIEIAIAEGRRKCVEQARWERERSSASSQGLNGPAPGPPLAVHMSDVDSEKSDADEK